MIQLFIALAVTGIRVWACSIGSDKSSALSGLSSSDSSIVLEIVSMEGSFSDSGVYLQYRVSKEDEISSIPLFDECSPSSGDFVAVSLKHLLQVPPSSEIYKISLFSNVSHTLCISNVFLFDSSLTETQSSASSLTSEFFNTSLSCLHMNTEAVQCWSFLDASTDCSCDLGSIYSVVECSECVSGRFEETFSCGICPRGTFSSAGASSCSSCSAGTFNDIVQQSECKLCVQGKYGPNSGASACFDCDFGKFASERASDQCTVCPPNTFGDSKGSSSCTSCPLNAQSSQASTSLRDCFCPFSFYGKAFQGEDCKTCATGNGAVTCPTNTSIPIVGDGWFFVDFPDPSSIVKCEPLEACTQTVTGQTVCSSGYSGEICSECSEKYSRLGTRCQTCPDHAWILVVTLLLLYVLFCFAVVKGAEAFQRKFHSIGICFSWIQILSLYSALPVQWPNSVLSLYDAASASNFNLELFSPACSTSVSFWGMWYLQLSFPFIFAGSLGILYLLQLSLRIVSPSFPAILVTEHKDIMLWVQTGDERHLAKHDPFFPGRYVYAYTLVMTYCYTLLVSATVNPLNCVESGDGKWRMLRNQQVICYEGFWLTNVLPTVLLGCVIYLIGIPFLMWYILFRYRGRRDSNEFLAYFGGLVLPYRHQYEWFELVNMIRKSCIAVFIDFFFLFQTAYMQMFATIALVFVFLMLQFFLSPYKLPFNNSISFLWISVSMFCLFTGLVFVNESVADWETRFFAVMVYFMFVFACVMTVKVGVQELMYYRKYNKNLDKRSTVKSVVERTIERVKELCTIFPRSYSTLSNHVALLPIERQEKFYTDCSHIFKSSKFKHHEIRSYCVLDIASEERVSNPVSGIPLLRLSPKEEYSSGGSVSMTRTVSHRGIDDIPFARRMSKSNSRNASLTLEDLDEMKGFTREFKSPSPLRSFQMMNSDYADVDEVLQAVRMNVISIGSHRRSVSAFRDNGSKGIGRVHQRSPSVSDLRTRLDENEVYKVVLQKRVFLRSPPPPPSSPPLRKRGSERKNSLNLAELPPIPSSLPL